MQTMPNDSHHLSAAPLTNSSPAFPVFAKKQFAAYKLTAEEREAIRLRQAKKRKRDRLGLLSLLVPFSPRPEDLYAAIHNFAMSPNRESDPPAVRRAIRAIRENENWEDDVTSLVILAFALDEFMNRWKKV